MRPIFLASFLSHSLWLLPRRSSINLHHLSLSTDQYVRFELTSKLSSFLIDDFIICIHLCRSASICGFFQKI